MPAPNMMADRLFYKWLGGEMRRIGSAGGAEMPPLTRM
jgi:hypothetical protein